MLTAAEHRVSELQATHDSFLTPTSSATESQYWDDDMRKNFVDYLPCILVLFTDKY